MLNTDHGQPVTIRGHAALGLTIAAALSLLLTAGPAAAHGISGDATERTILGFISVGIEHPDLRDNDQTVRRT